MFRAKWAGRELYTFVPPISGVGWSTSTFPGGHLSSVTRKDPGLDHLPGCGERVTYRRLDGETGAATQGAVVSATVATRRNWDCPEVQAVTRRAFGEGPKTDDPSDPEAPPRVSHKTLWTAARNVDGVTGFCMKTTTPV